MADVPYRGGYWFQMGKNPDGLREHKAYSRAPGQSPEVHFGLRETCLDCWLEMWKDVTGSPAPERVIHPEETQ